MKRKTALFLLCVLLFTSIMYQAVLAEESTYQLINQDHGYSLTIPSKYQDLLYANSVGVSHKASQEAVVGGRIFRIEAVEKDNTYIIDLYLKHYGEAAILAERDQYIYFVLVVDEIEASIYHLDEYMEIYNYFIIKTDRGKTLAPGIFAFCGNDEQFEDVSTESWYYDSVKFVRKNGLFNGTSDNTFSPDGSMTRAMFVTVLGRIAERSGETIAGYTSNFEDVKPGEWYTDYVNWASAKGIVEGYSNKVFGTNDNVTREQMAVLLYRMGQYLGRTYIYHPTRVFIDRSSISSWAIFAVEWATESGIIEGYTDLTFKPQKIATRAEAATIFMRFEKCRIGWG